MLRTSSHSVAVTCVWLVPPAPSSKLLVFSRDPHSVSPSQWPAWSLVVVWIEKHKISKLMHGLSGSLDWVAVSSTCNHLPLFHRWRNWRRKKSPKEDSVGLCAKKQPRNSDAISTHVAQKVAELSCLHKIVPGFCGWWKKGPESCNPPNATVSSNQDPFSHSCCCCCSGHCCWASPCTDWWLVIDTEKYPIDQILPTVQARDHERRDRLTRAWLLCLQKLFVAVIIWALLRYSAVSIS